MEPSKKEEWSPRTSPAMIDAFGPHSQRKAEEDRMQAGYTPSERRWLIALAVLTFVGVNGAFLYGVAVDPGALGAAMRNPVSAAFMVEAFLMVIVLAWLLVRWGVSGISRTWFVVLSILGGVAFALPVALLTGAHARVPPRASAP
jgi:hypothetical protein